jgi:hypothetical protein
LYTWIAEERPISEDQPEGRLELCDQGSGLELERFACDAAAMEAEDTWGAERLIWFTVERHYEAKE